MGSLREPPGAPMKPKWEPKGSQKRSKNGVFFKVRMGKCEMSRKYTIYYTSATSATPKNDNFCSFSRSQNDVETDRRPSGSKMVPKCCPRASRAGPEPKIDSKRVPKGVPRGCQNDPEIAFWKVLGHRCDAKGLQGVSGHPPRLKMQPNLSQNGTTNDTKTLLCFLITKAAKTKRLGAGGSGVSH